MDFILNDIDSSKVEEEKDMPKWKKYLIIGGVIAIFVILIIIS